MKRLPVTRVFGCNFYHFQGVARVVFNLTFGNDFREVFKSGPVDWSCSCSGHWWFESCGKTFLPWATSWVEASDRPPINFGPRTLSLTLRSWVKRSDWPLINPWPHWKYSNFNNRSTTQESRLNLPEFISEDLWLPDTTCLKLELNGFWVVEEVVCIGDSVVASLPSSTNSPSRRFKIVKGTWKH